MSRNLIPLIIVLALASCGMSGGDGFVLETGTGSPITSALITLECRQGKFPEGSVLIKTLQKTTGAGGRFSFSTLDVAPCSYAYVKASKPGYMPADQLNLIYSHDDYSNIPKQIVLTPEGDKVMIRLKFLASMIKASSAPDPAYLYMALYPNFDEAQRIAKTDSERAFVLASICPRLIELYAGLSEHDRARIVGAKVMGLGGEATVEYEEKLKPYCKVPAPAT